MPNALLLYLSVHKAQHMVQVLLMHRIILLFSLHKVQHVVQVLMPRIIMLLMPHEVQHMVELLEVVNELLHPMVQNLELLVEKLEVFKVVELRGVEVGTAQQHHQQCRHIKVRLCYWRMQLTIL